MSDDTTPIYFRVSPAIWRARTWTDDMRLLACYLLTSPHRTLEGLFILPKGYICADLKWSDGTVGGTLRGTHRRRLHRLRRGRRGVPDRKALKYQRPENPNMDKAAIRRLVTVPASSLDALFLASAQQYAPRLAERLAERLPERFGKSQLCSSSTQLNPALSAPAREEPVDNSPAPKPEDQERGRSIDQQEQPEPERSENPPVGHRHLRRQELRDPRVPGLGLRPAAPGDRQEQAPRAVAGGRHERAASTRCSPSTAGHLCAACQAGLGEYERPQLDGLCEQALVASLEGLQGRRGRGRGAAQPPAPLRARRARRRPHLRGAAARQARQAPARRSEGDRRLPAAQVRAASGRCEELRTSVNRRLDEKSPGAA